MGQPMASPGLVIATHRTCSPPASARARLAAAPTLGGWPQWESTSGTLRLPGCAGWPSAAAWSWCWLALPAQPLISCTTSWPALPDWGGAA